MRLSSCSAFLSLGFISALALPVDAGWTVTDLHPAGAFASVGNGVSETDEAGTALFGASPHAARWTGSLASFVDLNPVATLGSTSELYDTDGLQQVGIASPKNFIYECCSPAATLWEGSANTYVELHPREYDFSDRAVYATEGGVQTGFSNSNEALPLQAMRWESTPASETNIHPAGYNGSIGRGTDGTSISGVGLYFRAGKSGLPHAGLWKFSPDQFIDLHPAGFVESSASDVDGDVQVGWVLAGESSGPYDKIDSVFPTEAALWTGSAASFINMNPAGALSSTIHRTDDGFHVGSATFLGGESNAGLWTGSSNSFFNLHALLQAGAYSRSVANDIWTDGQTIRIVGTAHNLVLNRDEAVLWTFAVPEPGELALIIGLACSAHFVKSRRPRGY